MTASSVPMTVPADHPAIARWVDEIAALTAPDSVVWCGASLGEGDRPTGELVEQGTFVARVEDRTSIPVIGRDEGRPAAPTSRLLGNR